MNAHLTQLFSLLYCKGDIERLSKLVRESKTTFEEKGEFPLWQFWNAQALIASGELNDALNAIGQITDPEQKRGLQVLTLRAKAERSGDKSELLAYLEREFEATGNGIYLFELCEIRAEQQEWSAVANNAERLLQLVQTPAALRLGAHGLFNAGKSNECLELLRSNTRLFPNAQLPVDLQRLCIACEQRLGLIDQALEHAHNLATETEQLQDKANLINLKIVSGDPKGATLIARELLERRDVAPESLLQLANLLRVEDVPLAQDLLSKAVREGAREPQFLAAAVDVAFKVNKEDVLATLFPSFLEAAQSSGAIRMMSLDEVKSMLAKARGEREKALSIYERGRLPIHIAAEVFSSSIPEMFHRAFCAPDLKPNAFVAHGGRTLQTLSGCKRLYLDITGLFMAFELKVLDAVEKEFSPIFLPSNINQVLLYALEKTAHRQPQQLENAKIIRTLIEQKKILCLPDANSSSDVPGCGDSMIGPSTGFLEAAQAHDGFIIDYFPLQHDKPTNVPDYKSLRVGGCGALTNALAQAGKLTQLEESFARQYLQQTTALEPPIEVPIGSLLFLRGNIAETLAAAKLLPVITENFRVYIEAGEAAAVDALLNHNEWLNGLRTEIRALIESIRKGLEDNQYRLMEYGADLQQGMRETNWGPETASLVYLLKAEPTDGAYVWIDDRFLNSFQSVNGVPIVTIVDVLQELHRRGRLDTASYRSNLHRLRNAKFKYIGAEIEELLAHLARSSTEDGLVRETPELAALRRYFADCVLDSTRLQKPGDEPTGPRPQGEIELLMGLHRVIREGLIRTWSDSALPDTVARARSTWLIENLWFDSAYFPRLFEAPNWPVSQPKLLGSALAHLYLIGISLHGLRLSSGDKNAPPRERYFSWLQSQFLSDKATFSSVGRHLEGPFTDHSWFRASSAQARKLSRMVLGDFYTELPTQLTAAVRLSKKTLKHIGIREFSSVETPKWHFKSEALWPAAERAMQGKRARIRASNGERMFDLTCLTVEDGLQLRFEADDRSETFGMSDPMFALLDRNARRREAVLRSQPDWFDMPSPIMEQKIKLLAGIADVRERMRQLHYVRENSPSFYFRRLRDKFKKRDRVFVKDLKPSPTSRLLQYFRIRNDSSEAFLSLWSEGVETLVAEVGFREAFERVSSLPVALPRALVEAYGRLTTSDHSAWAHEIKTRMKSPICVIHAIGLMLSKDIDRAKELITYLFSNEAEIAYKTFETILRWTVQQVRAEATTASPRSVFVAAWGHAVRLHNLIQEHSSNDKAAEFFRQFITPTAGEAFEVSDDIRGDVCHPNQLTRAALLMDGLSTVLKGQPQIADLLASLSAQISNLCFHHAEDRRVPKLYLLGDPLLHYNYLGSFLGEDRGDRLSVLLPSQEAQQFSSSHIRAEVDSLLSALLDNPNQPALWVILYALTGPKPFDGATGERARALVLRTDCKEFAKFEDNPRRLALRWVAEQGRLAKQEPVRQHVRDSLIRLAKALSKASGVNPPADSVDALLEACHLFSTGAATEVAAVREFTSLVSAIRAEWPSASTQILAVLKSLPSRLPLAESIEFWYLLFWLRATAGQLCPRITPNEVPDVDI